MHGAAYWANQRMHAFLGVHGKDRHVIRHSYGFCRHCEFDYPCESKHPCKRRHPCESRCRRPQCRRCHCRQRCRQYSGCGRSPASPRTDSVLRAGTGRHSSTVPGADSHATVRTSQPGSTVRRPHRIQPSGAGHAESTTREAQVRHPAHRHRPAVRRGRRLRRSSHHGIVLTSGPRLFQQHADRTRQVRLGADAGRRPIIRFLNVGFHRLRRLHHRVSARPSRTGRGALRPAIAIRSIAGMRFGFRRAGTGTRNGTGLGISGILGSL